MKPLVHWLRRGGRPVKSVLRRVKRRLLPPAPPTLDQLRERWWYYTIELAPGTVARGIYPDNLPMLPRLAVRDCEVAGRDCLDIGCMEGLIPTLWSRQGAARVVAVDGEDHCAEKMAAIRSRYGVRFDFRIVPTVYDLARAFPGQGFDLINLSGLLYHVFSPLMVLAGVRPLLKRNGLIVVSTNVVRDDSYTMEFNRAGCLQEEANTFWYLSVPLLDYMLRYLRLAPVHVLHLPHESVRSDINYVAHKPSGYLSVVCRAVDDPLPTADDRWMLHSSRTCWESTRLVDWARAASQPVSRIGYRGNPDRQFYRLDQPCLDLWQAVKNMAPTTQAAKPSDGHILSLADQS